MNLLLRLACLQLALVDPPGQASPAQQPSALDLVAALECVVSDAIARAEPSVVAIHREKGENPQETLAVRGRKRAAGGFEPGRARNRFAREIDPTDMISFDFGSGVVIGDEGQILTTYHVVRGAARLIVRAANRQNFEAEIIAADPRCDLAVIVPVAVPGVSPPRLKPMALGDSGTLRKGSFLLAIGNPFNAAQDGKPSASLGILSNVARRVQPEQEEMSSSRRFQFPNYPTLLQLDAKLNLGMSGGAVVNLKGELVGLTTMASSPAGFDAMAGYAIPMDRIGRRAAGTLKEGKEIEYGMLGIRPQLGNTNRVEEVTPNSPAAQGELQTNDEIVAVNDLPVTDFDSLILAINSFAPGDEVRLKIRRLGKEITKSVFLAKYPVDGEMIATNRKPAWRGLRVDYQSTMNARGAMPNFLEPLPGGVVVSEVEEGSSAARAGLKRLQVIRQVEKATVTSPPQFEKAIAGLKGPVTLLTDQGLVTLPE